MEAVAAGKLPDDDDALGLAASLADWVFAADGSGSFCLESDSAVLRFGSNELERIGDDHDLAVVRLGHEVALACSTSDSH